MSLYPTEGQGLTFFIIWREVFLSLYPMEGHVSKFLVADDYRLDPSYNLPFTKSDDVVANERVGVQIHEHLFTFPDIGIETGSIKDNSKKNETNNNNPTKRLGEVDYTKGRIFKITAYSAMRNITMNINDLNRSLTLKDTGQLL